MKFLKFQKNTKCKIIYPEDVLVGKSLDDKSKIRELSEITDDDLILDIGPKTIKIIKILLRIVKQFCGMVLQDILKIQILQTAVMKLQKKLLKK